MRAQPYRVRASVLSRNSSGPMDRTFPDVDELARWLGSQLRGNRRWQFRRLRVERFDGERWRRVRFEPLPLTFRLDGETIEALSWDDLIELEGDE